MLYNQICHRINWSKIRFSSQIRPTPTIDSETKKIKKLIKTGYITSFRLESGEDVSIVRPINLKSLHIDSDVLERHSKNAVKSPENKFVSFGENNSNTLATSSVEELMSHNISVDSHSLSPTKLLTVYSKLGKIRLTTLVVISTIAGSLMAPVPFDTTLFVLATLGTFLTSMAANTVNQILEVPYDSQMTRTRNRPLVLGKLSPMHASMFGSVCAISGLSLLGACHPVTFGLGLTNLLLYTAIYTPLKRASITNTWIGSVVGSLPPLIGWSAATGGIHAGGLLIASILFCWQFPHFMALSWNLRKDYSRAGYQMASMVNPSICKKSALRHSIFISLICAAAPLVGLTDWCFVVESFPFNVALCVLVYQFYSNATSSSSRKLFRYTLIHLPILMTLLILNKTYVEQ